MCSSRGLAPCERAGERNTSKLPFLEVWSRTPRPCLCKICFSPKCRVWSENQRTHLFVSFFIRRGYHEVSKACHSTFLKLLAIVLLCHGCFSARGCSGRAHTTTSFSAWAAAGFGGRTPAWLGPGATAQGQSCPAHQTPRVCGFSSCLTLVFTALYVQSSSDSHLLL